MGCQSEGRATCNDGLQNSLFLNIPAFTNRFSGSDHRLSCSVQPRNTVGDSEKVLEIFQAMMKLKSNSQKLGRQGSKCFLNRGNEKCLGMMTQAKDMD